MRNQREGISGMNALQGCFNIDKVANVDTKSVQQSVEICFQVLLLVSQELFD